MLKSIRFASYNSTGFNSMYQPENGPLSYISNIANENDIIFIQEHWLLDKQLHKVVSFLPAFTGTAISGVDASQSINTRSSLWRVCSDMERYTESEY